MNKVSLPMMVSLQRLRPSAAMTLATRCFFWSVVMVLGSLSIAAKYSVSQTVRLAYSKSSCKQASMLVTQRSSVYHLLQF